MKSCQRSIWNGWRVAVSGVILLGAALMTGCATTRGEVDINVAGLQNPTSGPAIKLVRVTDQRKFEVEPKDPSIPSLKDSDINNPAITARAVARKRNTWGKALGDILLPEGRTVVQLTQDALTRGFREAGYRVLAPGDAGYDQAMPVTATINQFWGWFTPGFWALTLECKYEVLITGPVGPFAAGDTIKNIVSGNFQVASTGAWMEVITKGVDDMSANLKSKLKKS